MKTFRQLLFVAMTLVSLAGMAQTHSVFTWETEPVRDNIDSSIFFGMDYASQSSELNPIAKDYYNYDSTLNVFSSRSINYNLDINVWENNMIEKRYSNAQNQLIKIDLYFWDEGSKSWWLSTSEEIGYDAQGNIASNINSSRASVDTELIPDSKFETIIDDSENSTISISYTWINNQWEMTARSKTSSVYDKVKGIGLNYNYGYNGVNWTVSSVDTTKYTYYLNGNIKTSYRMSGSFQFLESFVYDDNNNIIMEEHKLKTTEDWRITSHEEKAFDNNSHVLDRIWFDIIDGIPVYKSKISYTYNNLGVIFAESQYKWDTENAKWLTKYRFIDAFDKYNRVVNQKCYRTINTLGDEQFYGDIYWYYKVKIESLKVIDNKILTITFDSELDKNNFASDNITIKSNVQKSGDLFVESARVGESDSSSLVILLNRAMVAGEKFTISMNEGLNTDNGRNVAFEVEMGNTATEVSNVENDEVNVFPSLATDKITVTSSAEIAQIQIYSVSGVEVAQTHVGSTNSVDVSVNGLPAGMYKVVVTTAHSNFNSTIIKR